METLSLSKDREPKVFASVGQCALFRALKPEQIPQLVKVAELQRFDPGEAIVIELDGRPAKEFTLEEVRQQIRIDGKRNLTLVRDGKRVKLVMELAGRLDMPAAGPAGAASRVARRPA